MSAVSQTLPEILRFLILVPHRDTVKLLREYRRRLFGAVFPGAFSFPIVVPLALLSRPCTGEELKGIARTLRQTTLTGEGRGKIAGGALRALPFPHEGGGRFLSDCSFFGPALDLPMPELLLPGLLYPFPAAVLVAALVEGEGAEFGEKAPPLGAFSFRTAAAANMVIRPLVEQPDGRTTNDRGAVRADPYSLEWKIGRLSWLPAGRG
jgi:hypothetical protein